MKMFRISATAIAVLIAAASCHKNDNNPPVTTLSKVQAKWSVTSKVLDKPKTAAVDSTYTGVSADYVDFRTDSKVYRQIKNVKDTASYSVTNDSALVLGGVTSKIAKLSSTEFVIKQTLVVTTGSTKDTTLVTYNLKK